MKIAIPFVIVVAAWLLLTIVMLVLPDKEEASSTQIEEAASLAEQDPTFHGFVERAYFNDGKLSRGEYWEIRRLVANEKLDRALHSKNIKKSAQKP